jgi:hypothetical protein
MVYQPGSFQPTYPRGGPERRWTHLREPFFEAWSDEPGHQRRRSSSCITHFFETLLLPKNGTDALKSILI